MWFVDADEAVNHVADGRRIEGGVARAAQAQLAEQVVAADAQAEDLRAPVAVEFVAQAQHCAFQKGVGAFKGGHQLPGGAAQRGVVVEVVRADFRQDKAVDALDVRHFEDALHRRRVAQADEAVARAVGGDFAEAGGKLF